MKPRVLFLVPSDYDELRAKGVDGMIRKRDEHGFFERVITVHPLAYQDRVLDLDAVHRVHEFSLGRALRKGVWRRFTAPIRALQVLHAVIRIARTERIDLIRATDPYATGLLAWAVSRVIAKPYCVSIHADYDNRFALAPARGFKGWLRRLSRWCPGFVLRRAALVLPIRPHLGSWAIRRGVPPAKVRVIPHGVEPASFGPPALDARQHFGLPSDKRVVSFVGRLAPDNYVADMVETARRILHCRTDVVFVFMGDGPQRRDLERWQAADDIAARNVRVLGFQPRDVAISLRFSSEVALCLMGGFSLLEAAAAACPSVAYDVEWHREIVQNEITGMLVQEGDVDAVVRSIERLLDDSVMRHTLGANARALVGSRYTEEIASAIKREQYQHLLNQGIVQSAR